MSTKLTKEEFAERYLKEGVPFQTLIRKRLISLGIKEEKCERCGISEWRGKPIQIQIHHINGNRNDNRLENLQMLCPNCHAQTENYQAKNIHVYEPREKACINCGRIFIARGDYQKCCSVKCRDEYSRKNQREYKSPYTKKFMQELCQKYNTLDEIGFVIHKTKGTVKRNLIQHGLFEEFLRKRDFHNKPVLQYDLEDNLIKEWPSISDAQESLKIYHIGLVCKGKRKSAGGFIWKFKNIENTSLDIVEVNDDATDSITTPKILQYDLNGDFIREFNTLQEASETTNTNKTSIVLCIQGKHKHANNYIWKYKDREFSSHIDISDIGSIHRTPVLMYDTQGTVLSEFPSVKEAAANTKIGYTNIIQCLRGTAKSAGGYVWRYKNFSKKPLDGDILNRPIPTEIFQSKVKVLQYDLEGHFVKEFKTIAEASTETNVKATTIEKCFNGKCERAGNFMWRRKEQEDFPLLIPPYNPKPKRAKAILQYDNHGNFIQEYQSMEEVLKVNNISRGTLMKCLSDKRKSYNGFVWRNKEGLIPQNIDISDVNFDSRWNVPVVKCDLEGNELEEYSSVFVASKKTGISRTHINNSIAGHGRDIDNYLWKYK